MPSQVQVSLRVAYNTQQKHWSNEETMIQYIDHIIVPYVEAIRKSMGDEEAAALVIMIILKDR